MKTEGVGDPATGSVEKAHLRAFTACFLTGTLLCDTSSDPRLRRLDSDGQRLFPHATAPRFALPVYKLAGRKQRVLVGK